MQRLLIAAVLLSVMAGGVMMNPALAQGTTQTITIVNRATSHSTLMRVERALLQQAKNLQRHWPIPTLRFGTGGWPLFLIQGPWQAPGWTQATTYIQGTGSWGFHWMTDAGSPYAVVGTFGTSPRYWTTALSHEVMEMLVDPIEAGVEVCDPVANAWYVLHKVRVADAVFPRWYVTGSQGPWDLAGKVTRAGQTL